MNLSDIISKNQASIEGEDLIKLIPLVWELEPKVVLEIGAWRGYSAQTWLRAFDPEIMITMENNPEALQFMNDRLFRGEFTETDEKHGLLTLLAFDSHTQEALNSVKYLLEKRKIDFLFIDGDHSYEGVKRDFEMYAPFVRKGGIIAFHDAIYHADNTEEVDIFWNEIRNNYRFKEIKEGKNSTGIGVIWYE